jgi:hypothetical protein
MKELVTGNESRQCQRNKPQAVLCLLKLCPIALRSALLLCTLLADMLPLPSWWCYFTSYHEESTDVVHRC